MPSASAMVNCHKQNTEQYKIAKTEWEDIPAPFSIVNYYVFETISGKRAAGRQGYRLRKTALECHFFLKLIIV